MQTMKNLELDAEHMVNILRRSRDLEMIASFIFLKKEFLISVGRENPMGMSATPNQGEEKIHGPRYQEEMPPKSTARCPSPLASESKQQCLPLHLVCLFTLLHPCSCFTKNIILFNTIKIISISTIVKVRGPWTKYSTSQKLGFLVSTFVWSLSFSQIYSYS